MCAMAPSPAATVSPQERAFEVAGGHIFAERSAEKRREGEAREADNLSCQSWNERMWSDGGPIDPSPTIDQAVNGGFTPSLEGEAKRTQYGTGPKRRRMASR
jgi:hypothetical protein